MKKFSKNQLINQIDWPLKQGMPEIELGGSNNAF